MEGRRIILNDGTRLEGGEAGYSQGFLWIYLHGMTMMQAAMLFLNPEKTAKIVFQYGEMQDEYEGYTSCININIDVDGRLSVCLTREV